jgi:hypothetical protein
VYGYLFAALGVAAFLAVVAWRRACEAHLARIRAGWGEPRLRERRLVAMLESHRARAEACGSASLSDRTWADLNLDQVFSAIDRSESTLGQHALYHRLRTAPLAPDLGAFEALVSTFSTNVGLRERAQLALGSLQDVSGYNLWYLARARPEAPPAWHVAFPILSGLSLAALAVSIWFHQLPIAVTAIIVNAVVSMSVVNRKIADAAALRQVAPLIHAAERLRFLAASGTGDLVLPLEEVVHLRRLKTIARWASDNPLLITLDASVGLVMLSDLVVVLYGYLNIFFLLDTTAVYFGRRRLRAEGARLVGIIAAMGDVDAALGVASLRESSDPWTRPRLTAEGPARIVGAWHPLVPNAVPNSVELRPSHGMLVTGSHMSGKSTLLRTVGVASVMAQTIHTCLAASYEAPAFAVMTAIGRSDDITTGKSYYLAEVESLLELVRGSGEEFPHLFLLDELFRGTNAVERIAAGESVLRELVLRTGRPKPHVAIAATHDNELVEMLADCYAAYHFGDSIGPHGLVFDYRLLVGPATTRNAITLLRLQGAPDGLVERAMTTAAALDRARQLRSH